VIKSIAHVAIVTSDLDRAVEFYTNVIGFHEVRRLETTHSGTIAFLSLDGTQIELFGGGAPQEASATEGKVGYRHMALLVDDVDAEYERLKAAGAQFYMEPTTPDPGIRLAFFRDPDGNPIEIITLSD
jgi:catechol 2,3-dioxygenase-like lactoylglutathione lyase family enzyme